MHVVLGNGRTQVKGQIQSLVGQVKRVFAPSIFTSSVRIAWKCQKSVRHTYFVLFGLEWTNFNSNFLVVKKFNMRHFMCLCFLGFFWEVLCVIFKILIACFDFFLTSFRTDWLIERQGKWAEPDYPGVTYPPFACGAGSVLSADLVHWLVRNADSLKRFQVISFWKIVWLKLNAMFACFSISKTTVTRSYHLPTSFRYFCHFRFCIFGLVEIWLRHRQRGFNFVMSFFYEVPEMADYVIRLIYPAVLC